MKLLLSAVYILPPLLSALIVNITYHGVIYPVIDFFEMFEYNPLGAIVYPITLSFAVSLVYFCIICIPPFRKIIYASLFRLIFYSMLALIYFWIIYELMNAIFFPQWRSGLLFWFQSFLLGKR